VVTSLVSIIAKFTLCCALLKNKWIDFDWFIFFVVSVSQFRGVLVVIEGRLYFDRRFRKRVYHLLILCIHFLYMKVCFLLLVLFLKGWAFGLFELIYLSLCTSTCVNTCENVWVNLWTQLLACSKFFLAYFYKPAKIVFENYL
jgi:hypothetical protein